jgi:hypothetical protein
MKNRMDELFRLARTVEPDIYRVEMGLETRVLARLRAEHESLAVWFTWTWRLVPVFAVLVMALGGWYYTYSPANIDMPTAITANYERSMHISSLMGD